MRDIEELAEAQSPFDPEIERKGGTSESSKSARKRGTWLTIWSVFLILANAVGAIRSILVILSITTVPF